jgi:Asp-tRNA(Asn)/Glu-tRNA(Gln) amidotransferase A subunit family amidase
MPSPETQPLPYQSYVRHDAMSLAELVRRREVSADELLEAALARMQAVNGEINAVINVFEAAARAQIARGLPEGPLSGVPFLLKDLFIDLQGTTTTSGSRFLKDTVARHDSFIAERYRRAGLVMFGKTHSSEFGASGTSETQLFGATRNPWDTRYSPGGSSGGASAAVAAGITPVANASDAGGSIRAPAGYCGLFGLKPTRGRVPLGPNRFDGGGGLATVHAITRSVRDSAALLDAVDGPALGDLYGAPAKARPYLEEVAQDPRPLHIAVISDSYTGIRPSAECQAALDDAVTLCTDLGHHLIPDRPRLDPRAFAWARGVLFDASAAAGIHGLERIFGRKAQPEDFERNNWASAERGSALRAEDLLAARDMMYQLHRQMAEFMTRYDLVLSPTVALHRFEIGTLCASRPEAAIGEGAEKIIAYTSLANLTGQPSMSVPLHWTADKFPVGVMFTGRFADEATLFGLAAQLERARPWLHKLPATTVAANA